MSEFSPTHWVVFAVLIVAPLVYGLYHAIRGVIRLNDWRRERAERKAERAKR